MIREVNDFTIQQFNYDPDDKTVIIFRLKPVNQTSLIKLYKLIISDSEKLPAENL